MAEDDLLAAIRQEYRTQLVTLSDGVYFPGMIRTEGRHLRIAEPPLGELDAEERGIYQAGVVEGVDRALHTAREATAGDESEQD